MDLRISMLHDLKPGSETLFGGKAEGLARLISAGADVPEGFAVEASRSAPEGWGASTREAFLEMCRPLLEGRSLAVRSSALGEDSAEHSFAGLFETVLEIKTPEEALQAAGRCIASGAAPRVLTYSGGNAPLPVGLVVQFMVPARAAGVCFTADPAGKDCAVVLETVAGTGESLVSGSESPERWRVYKNGLGTFESRVEDSAGILEAADAERIAAEGAGLAERFGYPLDLEWALDGEGHLWWLQARPITAAKPPPVYDIDRSFEGDDGPVTVWANWNVRETLPEPLYPLTWTWWRDVVLPIITFQVVGTVPDSPLTPHFFGLDRVHGRIYFNMNAALAFPLMGRFFPRMIRTIDATAAEALEELRKKGVLRPRRLPVSRIRLVFPLTKAMVLSLWRLRWGLMPRRSLAVLEEDGVAMDGRGDLAALSDGELIEEIRLLARPECARLRNGLQMEMVAMIVYGIAKWAFRVHPKAVGMLATGIPGNPTTEISLGIDTLAGEARPLSDLLLRDLPTSELLEQLRASEEGRGWLDRLDSFLARYGHRGPMEFDLGAVRWAEDPSMIIELVKARLRSKGTEDVTRRMERLREKRAGAVNEAVAASPLWKRPILRRLARLVELHMPLREAPKHYAVFVFRRARSAALELGRRFAREGILDTQGEVFYLEWPELVKLAGDRGQLEGLRGRIEVRKAQLVRYRSETPPDLYRSDGVPVEEKSTHDVPVEDGVLRGTGISPGRAEGPVRILTEPDPRLVREGDILVMRYADPGWTPLFPMASAVVMEVGGLMCHAAVVAREMGIPAVFGVPGALDALKEGRVVTVDGDAGTVKQEEGESTDYTD